MISIKLDHMNSTIFVINSSSCPSTHHLVCMTPIISPFTDLAPLLTALIHPANPAPLTQMCPLSEMAFPNSNALSIILVLVRADELPNTQTRIFIFKWSQVLIQQLECQNGRKWIYFKDNAAVRCIPFCNFLQEKNTSMSIEYPVSMNLMRLIQFSLKITKKTLFS